MIYLGNNIEILKKLPPAKMIFADPPDNLGIPYPGFKDRLTENEYYNNLELIILESLRKCETFWLSYYWQHDLEIKWMVRDILKYRHPTFADKTFIWRYTFGQHKETDCGSGFRYILRLSRATYFNTQSIRVESDRQKYGDKRANPEGRVPDDIWEYPRVTGNSIERQKWFPTQHPHLLLCRIVELSTNIGETVYDLYSGSGAMHRACTALNRHCIAMEISKETCDSCGLLYKDWAYENISVGLQK